MRIKTLNDVERKIKTLSDDISGKEECNYPG